MIYLENYLISDCHLSCAQVLQSLVISEYGLRHLDEARNDPDHKWGHYIIASIQFMPLIGQAAMLVECVFSNMLTRIKTDQLLFEGSQRGADGAAAADKVLAFVNRIDTLRESGILFNRRKITGSIEGGACSSMALDFANSFFKLQEVQGNSEDFFLKTIRALGPQFAECSEEMRIRQAAFNTIEVVGDAASIDASKNKVQSLANFHRFKISYASNEIAVDGANYDETLKREVSNLSNGLYLLRTILPSNNERREKWGHSMIYFKKRSEGLFYDPNVGAKYMKNVSHLPTLAKALTSYFIRFQTSKARFYRLNMA